MAWLKFLRKPMSNPDPPVQDQKSREDASPADSDTPQDTERQGISNSRISRRTTSRPNAAPSSPSSLPPSTNVSFGSSIQSPQRSPGTSQEHVMPDPMAHIRGEVMANWLYAKQEGKFWNMGEPGEGVFIKKSKGCYAFCPAELLHDGSNLYQSVALLNVRCAMTVNTRIIKLVLSQTDLPYVYIEANMRLQVIPDVTALPFCQKNQSAAFVASLQTLIVWEDNPTRLLERAQEIQDALVKMIWSDEYSHNIADKDDRAANLPFSSLANELTSLRTVSINDDEPRRMVLWQALYTSLAIMLLTSAIGAGWRQVAIQHVQEPKWPRFLFVIALPGQFWLALFFFQAFVGNLAQLAGPLGLMSENSKFFSGKAPKRLECNPSAQLPHVTIQLPVYKENLRCVIEPTIRSIKQAIATYELQGGTANVFINDDGMQAITDEESIERQEFYDENSIGWVARPKHDPYPEKDAKRFLRRGKFKKASNMNYALRMSVRVEELMNSIERHEGWSQLEENQAYEDALQIALNERQGETWADGSIRIGDYILLVDADTRLPTDCLLEAVSEMEQSPEVAILQYASGVMNVTNNFFESGITFFTNTIYTMIRFAVASGDVAPFVGHNAVLRWSALQETSYECEIDHWEKFWSENTVSEDFDMALRLQSKGYLVRLGAYKGDGYKEGVSLTVYDELSRWEKYAYGCNELIFHPFSEWFFKGPFKRLFLDFIFSSIPLPSKITILAYIGTYYALSSAWALTALNYFLAGFFNGWLDHYYLDSFKIYFSIVVVFTALGNFSLAVFRYRIGEGPLIRGLLLNLKWIPLMTIFLGGLSLHLSQAICAHFLGIDMQWGSTAKEVEDVSFGEALRRVLRRFKWTFLCCLGMTGVMLSCRYALPEEWQIHLLIAWWPMATVIVNHFLLPIVLNPQLMAFSW